MAAMSAWTDQQLESLGGANELEIAPRRADGTLRVLTTIWVVRVDDDLSVRSWSGRSGGWFRSATRSGRARIRVGSDEVDLAFEPADVERPTVDAAYRHKYGRSRYVDAMVADGPASTTLRLIPN